MNEIDEIIQKFDGLLDENAARMIKNYRTNIEKAYGSVGLIAKVLSCGKIKKLPRSTVRNFIIGDESGCCILALWGNKAYTEIKEGDVIKIIDGYAREGYYGKEINVWDGEIKKVDVDIKVKCSHFINFKGILEKKYPTEVYINGEKERFFMKIVVGGREFTLIDERIRDMRDVGIGEYVEIKWAYEKNARLYVDDVGRIKAIK